MFCVTSCQASIVANAGTTIRQILFVVLFMNI